jgi:uncharacterized NAD(P)/FAD-binding protein YdhS
MQFDVGVIGAGASGVLIAAHLRRIAPEVRVAILDAGARAARGLAYGTPYGAHLLNVPAGRMSAFADDGEHFLRWLRGRVPDAAGHTFAPRSLYGEYLAEVLAEAAVERVHGTAVGLTRGDGWRVHLHDGRTVGAHAVVLALGNLPPADPLPVSANNYLRDPWAPGVAQGLPPDAPIAILGTGLTMIDLVLALRDEGHRGPIHAISRHGLLPRAHSEGGSSRPPFEGGGKPPHSMLRWMRGEIAKCGDWRAVVDSLRPHTQRIWRGWTPAQRGSFLRHARTLWDVHRHRCAPEVAAQLDALLAAGTLTVHRGRVRAMEDVAGGIRVTFDGGELVVARAINCTGPASNYAAIDLPLVAQLRRAGWLVPDPLRLGVETDEHGRLLGADGAPVAGLFTIGPLMRPALWESTAIPEIRAQAAALAALLR